MERRLLGGEGSGGTLGSGGNTVCLTRCAQADPPPGPAHKDRTTAPKRRSSLSDPPACHLFGCTDRRAEDRHISTVSRTGMAAGTLMPRGTIRDDIHVDWTGLLISSVPIVHRGALMHPRPFELEWPRAVGRASALTKHTELFRRSTHCN